MKNKDIGVNDGSWQGEGRNSPLRLKKTLENLAAEINRDLAEGTNKREYTFSEV